MLINTYRFPLAKGCGVNPESPYRYGAQVFKNEEELWAARLLRAHGVVYSYEVVEFPHFRPDFVFHKPLVWLGKPCKGVLIWGIEMKHITLRPEWKLKSELLYSRFGIKILVLSRDQIYGYYRRRFIPLAIPA